MELAIDKWHNISGGHKDWAIKDKKDCTCPGKILYELLPEIRNKHDLKNPSNEKY